MKALFRRFAERVALIVGTPWAFIVALTIIGVWGVSGPLFSFSTHWQLVVNSFTTIGTFLMVFIIQNTQNRDFKAIQIKLDALLHASPATPPGLVNLHNLSDNEHQACRHAESRHMRTFKPPMKLKTNLRLGGIRIASPMVTKIAHTLTMQSPVLHPLESPIFVLHCPPRLSALLHARLLLDYVHLLSVIRETPACGRCGCAWKRNAHQCRQ